MKKKPSKHIIQNAIIKAMGNLTVAAKSLGCDRTSIYNWVEKEGLQQAVQEGRDQLLDLAENKMASKISEGDTTALIFFLKTQGKSRGYSEKQEIEQSGEMKITITRKLIK